MPRNREHIVDDFLNIPPLDAAGYKTRNGSNEFAKLSTKVLWAHQYLISSNWIMSRNARIFLTT